MLLNYSNLQPMLRFAMSLLAAVVLSASTTVSAETQERPAKRVASIVGVAVEEYGKGVDASGQLISQMEYDEAVSFLADAREASARLSGGKADTARAIIDELIAAVNKRVVPSVLGEIHGRFVAALGADAALDLPTVPVDLIAGRAIYERSCASCHGVRGLGDGPQAKGMEPPPPPLGDAVTMADRTPALQYRVVSVGIAGTAMPGWESTLTPDERWSVVWYLHTLRAADGAAGEGVYMQRCAGCHGVTGASDGALSQALTKFPAELSSFAWQAERSDAQIAAAIRNGVAGSAMPASRELTDDEIRNLVGHVRLLAVNDVPTVAAGGARPTGEGAARVVLGLLDEALAAARSGRKAEAGDKAFDAYIAFEPLETPARAKSPGVVASMEARFADFKGAVKAGDLRAAERTRNAIEAEMPAIIELTRPTSSGWGAFLQSLLIILREGLEAILVIGAIVAFLMKTGHRERLRAIWIGVGLALGASALTAVVLATLLRALPASREIIEGVTMLVAVAVLFSVSYWLISKVEAARWQQFIKEKVTAALERGGGKALAFVAFLAVYREGAETALFYQALIQEGSGTLLPISAGIVVGGVLLAIIFVLFYRYGVRIPLRPFFAVTSALLYYMAFVFMGKGVRELQEGNVVSITALPGWPHVDAMGIFPSVETIAAQFVLLVLFVFALLKTFWPKRSVTLPTVPPADVRAVSDERLESLGERVAALEQRLEAIEQEAGVVRR